MNELTFSQLRVFLRASLLQQLPGAIGHKKMMPYHRHVSLLTASETARKSGVLIAIYPNEQGKPTLILIKRSNDGGKHAGQIALPGGKMETFDETIVHTALREAEEEVALNPKLLDVLGLLSPLYISVSDFLVQPVVACLDERPRLLKADLEVDLIIEQDLFRLFQNKDFDAIAPIEIKLETKTQENKVPAYRLDTGAIVWGATAMILAELEIILFGE